jgi:ketosteroid isomerase-like protein
MIVPAFLAGTLALAPGNCLEGPETAEISDQRQSFNAAIRDGDPEAIEGILADDVILVAGTRSDLFTGRAEQLRVWREEFDRGDDRLVFVRTSECIVPSVVTSMAMEYGRWRGENPAGDAAAGSYVAKWRRFADAWRIEVEVFMTESCLGESCPPTRE